MLRPYALFAALLALGPAARDGAAQVELRPGLVITRSVRIVPKTYRLPAPASLDSAVITVQGDDVTVDFQGATLEGMAPEADPDRAVGVAIRVAGGRNVRIVNARVRGYRVGILARGTRRLALIDNDVSYTWKPRLFSLVEHESLVDWLSFHHNEQDEWLRFGAAIYLADVSGGEVRGNRAVQGMNGLMLVRSDHMAIRDNEFSFNSGLGIGLYRSSDDTIVHNRIDYDVRGYSHRFYRRGQDSAGLLMFEQSSRNVVAYNSITHGGDGLFLWAGQSTMDSGTGGANDNLFVGNDFSFAPANGMEATFSRNTFVANRAAGNDYGLWAGYSFESRIVGNDFSGNRVGIAIEHGQDNLIVANRFLGDSTAIRLWADSIEPSEWGYPKHHDTRSRDYRVADNVFVRNRVAIRAARTSGLVVTHNRWVAVDSVGVLGDTAGFRSVDNAASDDTTAPPLPAEYARLAPPRPAGGVPESDLTRRDRSAIVVDEWGPYDWRSPKLWPADSTRAIPLRLAVRGPPGRWRVVARRGLASVSAPAGRVGDTVVVTPQPESAGDWELTLEYRGAATVSPKGVQRAAGQPYRFSYGRFEPAISWTVRFFTLSTVAESLMATPPPILTLSAPRLDYMWYRPTVPGLPRERWALEATGTVSLAPGTYTLRTISDDAVRVWVDGALVIDNWKPHESTVDAVPLAPGRHELRVEYYQLDGWTELRLDIVRGAARGTGSPGPH
ncbi:MAG TPA: NosD domain-containing protein [Gemmatimonadales bacterium]|jgi:parallel beta-helix repeat protein|nr:NosD domain-containing protein [Gemmatimonadales bacterium]